MADENKIEVKIVLDDGSIQTGFIKMEQAAEKLKKEFKTIGDVLDTDLVSKFKNSIRDIPIAFAGIAIGVLAVGTALKEAFDLTVAGEKLKAIDKQFEFIAEGSGIAAEALKAGLEKSAVGLISTNELLKIANESIINLGKGAERLPEVLDLSRKVAIALGRPLRGVFDGVVSGIESGNQKALRSQGIILDIEKAYDKYGKTINVIGTDLNKAQQQQALLNAVLEEGGKKFKNVQTGVTPISGDIQRISGALEDAREEFEKLTNTKLGSFFLSVADNVVQALKQMNEGTKTNAEETSLHFAEMRAELLGLQGNLPRLREEYDKLNPVMQVLFADDKATQIRKNVERIEELKLALKDVKIEAVNASDALSGVKENKKSSNPEANKQTEAQILAAKERDSQIAALQLKADQDFITGQETLIPFIVDIEQRKAAIIDTQNQQSVLNEEVHKKELDDIAIKFSDKKRFDDIDRFLAESALEEGFANTKKIRAAKTSAEIKKIEQDEQARRLSGYSNFFGNLASLSASSNKELAAIGNAAAIAKGVVDGYAAILSAYKAGSEFGPVTAAAFAAAAGIAAAVHLANLTSAAGGGGGSISAPASGGGVASGTEAPAGGSLSSNLPPQKPQTAIEVNIAGSVLDSHETGLRIVDLLNTAFDQNGVVVTGRAI